MEGDEAAAAAAAAARIRVVRCPKCDKFLPELPAYSVYVCGGCGATLQGNASLLPSLRLSTPFTVPRSGLRLSRAKGITKMSDFSVAR
jgi:ribosomal protein L37AE/L43A